MKTIKMKVCKIQKSVIFKQGIPQHPETYRLHLMAGELLEVKNFQAIHIFGKAILSVVKFQHEVCTSHFRTRTLFFLFSDDQEKCLTQSATPYSSIIFQVSS